MFDTPIEEMRAGISHSRRDIIWVQKRFASANLAFGDTSQMLKVSWHELDLIASQNILGMINDGELYCIRAKRFSHNLDFAKSAETSDFRETPYLQFPEITIGYKGSISKVQVEPYRVSVPRLIDDRIPRWAFYPTWGQIKRGVIWRLKNDFKPNNLTKWIIKNILARLLYLPEKNPDFWGAESF